MIMKPSRWALLWSVLSLPLSILSCIGIFSTWPAVFSNSPLRLVLILLIIGAPAIPLLLRRRGEIVVSIAGAITFVTQVWIFGSLNYWFA